MVARKTIVLALILQSSNALSCPDDQYNFCTPLGCFCLPKWGGTVGNFAEHLKNEIRGQIGGVGLQPWIEGSRDSSIGTAQPIPDNIRKALCGYISEEVMERARFKVGDSGILNLAGLSIQYGDRIYGNQVDAVTLKDVIVFRYSEDAFNNPSLWAHELTHVKQFIDWNVRDFSIRYARNSNSVEDPAYAIGDAYPAWAANHAPVGGCSVDLSPAPVAATGNNTLCIQFSHRSPGNPIDTTPWQCATQGSESEWLAMGDDTGYKDQKVRISSSGPRVCFQHQRISLRSGTADTGWVCSEHGRESEWKDIGDDTGWRGQKFRLRIDSRLSACFQHARYSPEYGGYYTGRLCSANGQPSDWGMLGDDTGWKAQMLKIILQ